MPIAKLTKTYVEKIPLMEKGQSYYFDTELKGFGVSIGAKGKTYFAQRDVNGKTVRSTIGKHGVFTCEEAREHARQKLAAMALGQNINHVKKKQKREEQNRVTFGKAIEAYRIGRKHLSKTTHYRLDCLKTLYLPDWQNKPLEEITRDMVFERHIKIGEKHGKTMANNVFQITRAVYNFAKHTHDDLPANPVTALSTAKAWYKQKRRRSVIKPSDLKTWYDEVLLLDNQVIRDFLLLLIFTGMRRGEALGLRWENIDFTEKTLTVPHTKNSEPLELPLSDYVYDLLKARKKHAKNSPWVFPGHGTDHNLVEPKNSVKKVAENCGVPFLLHDLRRTYITIAEGLDIPAFALKKMLNHKDNSMTSSYIVMETERLREPMQKVANKILELVADKE